MKKPELICYDFDGTLCNTLPDIAASMNVAFKRHGFDEIPEERVRDFIGSGISKLVERSVFYVLSKYSNGPLDPEILKEVGNEMATYYNAHLMDRSHLYNDTIEILKHFSGVHQIIVSNKPEEMVNKMLKHYKIDHYFALVVGGDTIDVCKPDLKVWEYIMTTMNFSEKIDGIMVGDSLPDVQFGKVAKLKTIAVSYGYNDVPVLKTAGADHIIDTLIELKTV